jgi:hypothetical protein
MQELEFIAHRLEEISRAQEGGWLSPELRADVAGITLEARSILDDELGIANSFSMSLMS